MQINMRKFAMRALAFLGAALCIAGGTANAASLDLSAALGFESRYLFRGVELAQASFEPSLRASYEGFYLSAWLNLPVGDEDNLLPGGQEFDLVGGYSAPLGGLGTVDVGVTYYTYPNLDNGFFDIYREDGDGLGANTIEPYMGFSFDAPLAPSIYFYHDFLLDTSTVQGGVSHSIPVADKTSVDLSGILGYVFDDDPGRDYLYGHLTANLSYAVSDTASIYGGVRYGGSDIAGGSVIDDASLGLRKSSGTWFGLGLKANF